MLDTVRSMAQLFGPRLDPTVPRDPDMNIIGLARPIIALLRRYFRAEVHGIERMPSGPALVVGNHNAGITFFEPFFLGEKWLDVMNGEDMLCFLAHDAMVRLPALGNMLLNVGVVQAGHESADEVLRRGRKIVVYPGGNYEAFRPYTQRHRIDFGGKTGFAKLALRHRVPIVPVLNLGGHETFFVLHRGERLAKLTGVRKYLRSESFPVFLGLPWGLGFGPIFHLPLPAKTLVEVGEPIQLNDYEPEAARDEGAARALADRVQATLQAMMERRVAKRRWPLLG